MMKTKIKIQQMYMCMTAGT